MLHLSGVNLRTELNITFAGKTVKLLAMGITQLDGDALVAAVLRAPFCVLKRTSLCCTEKKSIPSLFRSGMSLVGYHGGTSSASAS